MHNVRKPKKRQLFRCEQDGAAKGPYFTLLQGNFVIHRSEEGATIAGCEDLNQALVSHSILHPQGRSNPTSGQREIRRQLGIVFLSITRSLNFKEIWELLQVKEKDIYRFLECEVARFIKQFKERLMPDHGHTLLPCGDVIHSITKGSRGLGVIDYPMDWSVMYEPGKHQVVIPEFLYKMLVVQKPELFSA